MNATMLIVWLILISAIAYAQNPEPEKLLYVGINFDYGNFEIKSVELGYGYRDTTDYYDDEAFLLQLKDSKGRILAESEMLIANELIVEPETIDGNGLAEDPNAGIFEQEQVSALGILPYNENAEKIEVYSPDGRLVAEKFITDLALTGKLQELGDYHYEIEKRTVEESKAPSGGSGNGNTLPLESTFFGISPMYVILGVLAILAIIGAAYIYRKKRDEGYFD